MQLPNWWHVPAIHLACLRLGAVLNPLMPIFREHELAYMLGFAEAKAIVVPREFRGFDHPAMVAGLRAGLPALEHVRTIVSGRTLSTNGSCWTLRTCCPYSPRRTGRTNRSRRALNSAGADPVARAVDDFSATDGQSSASDDLDIALELTGDCIGARGTRNQSDVVGGTCGRNEVSSDVRGRARVVVQAIYGGSLAQRIDPIAIVRVRLPVHAVVRSRR